MPPEHEARSRAFYDHEQDEPRGRRRRTVADWGVSEDVFDRMPGPRFTRRGEEPRRREEAPRARFVRDETPRVRVDEEPRGRFAREHAPRVRGKEDPREHDDEPPGVEEGREEPFCAEEP